MARVHNTGGNMATGERLREGTRDIPPGSIVTCITRFDEKLEGEVIAFDYATKFIVIKNQTDVKGARKTNQDVRMLNMSYLKDFKIKKEIATKQPLPLQSLDLEKIEKRIHGNKSEKQQAIYRVGINVTPEGQKLFDHIAKTFKELHWKDKDIVVMDDVTIIPPYKVDNIAGKEERSVSYLKDIVKKHYESEQSLLAEK